MTDYDASLPLPPDWQTDWDEVRGQVTAAMPFCPKCGEPLYEPEKCVFCGQPIEQSDRLTDWFEPPEIKVMDCFVCGGKGTLQYIESKYNGHRHGECSRCGMRIFE